MDDSKDDGSFRALLDGNIHALKNLVESHGFDINSKTRSGLFLLYEACRYAPFEIVEYLVGQGAKIENNGQSALCPAVAKDDVRLVEFLIKHGADVNFSSDAQLPPIHHCKFKNVVPDVFGVLLNAGANINVRDNRGHAILYQLTKFRQQNINDYLRLGAVPSEADIRSFPALQDIHREFIAAECSEIAKKTQCTPKGLRL